ncbi:hypothetical protein [Paenibacillus sp. KN14-4R]|uniref:hypothetical protein n=1 Tax=Paenibacillus sp. KN14-4R TaxID=3445773 RepID=UPI003F9F2626
MDLGIRRRNWLHLCIFIVVVVSPFFIVKGCAESIVDQMQADHVGTIFLPNQYEVSKVSVHARVISRKGDAGNKKITYIPDDIQEVGWNNDVVIYKQVINQATKYGVLNTVNGEVEELPDQTSLERKLQEHQIVLKKVEDLFPETKGIQ